MEFYLSSYLTLEKFREIAFLVRKRIQDVYHYDDVPKDTELVFFDMFALNTNLEMHNRLENSSYDRWRVAPIHGAHISSPHPNHLSCDEIRPHHVFEIWPDADWDWTVLSGIPHIATEENVFIKYPNKPWDWNVLSKERVDLATYENVFVKYANKPWDWNGLTWQKDLATPENVFVKHADKPWKLSVLNHHDYWTIPLLERYNKAFPVKWMILMACNPHLMTYENIFIQFPDQKVWNWYAVSACPCLATYENVFMRHPDAPWVWSIISQQEHIATYENIFMQHPDAPWEWSIISQQEHIATYENVFIKHPQAPWNWTVLTVRHENIATLENIFVRHPSKPWDARVINTRKDLVTRENVFKRFPQSHLWDLTSLLRQVDLLFDADDEKELIKKKAAVEVIGTRAWNALVDPKYPLCRKRLMREYNGLIS